MEDTGSSQQGPNGSHNGHDSDDILDNPVSLSSANVSGDDHADSVSSDLLMIAPSQSTGSGSEPSDPRSVIPPLSRREKVTSKLIVSSSYDDLSGDSLLTSWKGELKEPRKDERVTYFGYTKTQWFAFSTLCIANVFATAIFSIQAPFYPREAEDKGATSTEHGLVLGVFELVVFIMAPIYGSLLAKSVNPKLMYILGMFTESICTIMFGFLRYVNGRVEFIALSFIIRIVQGCGEAAIMTAAFTIIALEFPDSVATTFAALETCAGVGLVVGPTVGGALYEVGGFLLPYVVMGGLLLLVSVVAFFILPSRKNVKPSLTKNAKGFLSLLKLPAVALSGFSVFVAGNSIGFLTSTLEPHLRDKFYLSPLYTGLIFIIDGGMYALSAPIWGRIVDGGSQPKWITLIGCTLTFSGFLLIGPVPFLPFDTILWVTIIGLVIHGMGIGASLVSGFIQALQDSIAAGFQDNVSTYGLVSGLWSSTFALGLFVGPSVGGLLLDHFGFQKSTYYVLGSQVVVVILVLSFICIVGSRKTSRDEERDPLLSYDKLSLARSTEEERPKSCFGNGPPYGTIECCPPED